MKNLQSEKKVIDGHEVEITPFPARMSLSLMWQLLSTFGAPFIEFLKGPIASLISVKQEKGTLTLDNIDVSVFNSLNAALFSAVNPDRAADLICDVCSTSRIDGRELSIDGINELFTRNLFLLYKVFIAALEVNYGDFLSMVGTITAVVPEPTKTSKVK